MIEVRPEFMEKVMNVREYIRGSWDKSLRREGHRLDGIRLPYCYNSPCADGLFDEFYYWDTCFINKGLLADGKIQDALHNVLNMAFLIERYGFMPNAAVTGMLNRSQPPLFGMMVTDIFLYLNDNEVKERLICALEKEYRFWMKERIFPCGLNRYGTNADRETKLFMATEAETRLDKNIDGDRETVGENILAECESGWDFSPRFSHECTSYAPVDLNALLYFYEDVLSKLSFCAYDREVYRKAAENRKERMQRYLYNGKIFTDAIPKKSFGIISAACAVPFVVGLTSNKSALLLILQALECEHGVSACGQMSFDARCQWGYPNMWAPLVWFLYSALKKTSLNDEARRIGEKYLATVEKSFEKTGKLWEKYDAVTGWKATVNEYAETEMLGWTAGVYNVLYDELNG